MNVLFIAFFISLIAENNQCVNFDSSCHKQAISELRVKCPNVQTSLSHWINAETMLIGSGHDCLDKAPNNFYVKKYAKLFNLENSK